jgi:small-conductance mechanosensitive channel
MTIWERLQDNLQEYWQIFILSLPKIAIAILILCVFSLVAFSLGRIFRRKMLGKASDSITITFVVRVIKSVLIIIGVILAFHALGFRGIAGGMLAGAGIGAIVIGFAFKEIGENFLAGIILVFDRPFNIGDTVMINNNMGYVVGLKFRTTHIKSLDGKDVYVPNGSVIRNDVVNFTRDGLLRHEFIIGLDYQDNIGLASKLIVETVNKHPAVIRKEKTHVLVDQFETNTINLKVLFWVNTFDYMIEALIIRSDVMASVKQALLENKFNLPANIQELKAYNGLPIPVTFQGDESAPRENRLDGD